LGASAQLEKKEAAEGACGARCGAKKACGADREKSVKSKDLTPITPGQQGMKK